MFPKDSAIGSFVVALQPLFGSQKATIETIIRTSEAYQAWRQQVERCAKCGKWVAKKDDGLIDHYLRNPDGDRPWWILCEGELGPIKNSDGPDDPSQLEFLLRHMTEQIQVASNPPWRQQHGDSGTQH